MTRYTDLLEEGAKPIEGAEAVAKLRSAKARYQGKIDKGALEHFARMAHINALLIRSTKVRLRAVGSGDRRQHKRADRLFFQALREWQRIVGRTFESMGEALRDIAQASRSAIAAIGMLNSGMQIAFKPKVTVE